MSQVSVDAAPLDRYRRRLSGRVRLALGVVVVLALMVLALVVGGIGLRGPSGSDSALSVSDRLVQAVLARDAAALGSLAAPEDDPNDTHNRVEALLGRLPAGELAVDRFTLTPTPSATAFGVEIRLTGDGGTPTTVSAGVMADFGPGNDGAGHWYVSYDPAG